MGVPRHEATTLNVGSLYPFMAEGPLSDRGILVGEDAYTRGAYLCDEFALYEEGLISSTNKIIFGRLGVRKSTYVKTMCLRHLVFGRRSWFLDPKGEYGLLCQYLGVTPIRLRPHGELRLNPLDPMTRLGDLPPNEVFAQQLGVLNALTEASLGRRLQPAQRTALRLALERVVTECERPMDATLQSVERARERREGLDVQGRVEPTIPMVIEAMLWPSMEQGRSMNMQPDELALEGKDVAHELTRFTGREELAGMFDGPTSPSLDIGGPVVSIDLSAVYYSPALGLLMVCVIAWLRRALEARRQRALARGQPEQTVVVIDEAWACLRDPAVAQWLLSSIKFSRQYGASYWLVFHKLSDLGAVGAAGSEQVRLVESMYDDIEIRVIYRQARGEANKQRDRFGLSDRELELVTQLRPGVAIHQVGDRSFIVRHLVSAQELPLVNTDQAMRSRAEEDSEEVA